MYGIGEHRTALGNDCDWEVTGRAVPPASMVCVLPVISTKEHSFPQPCPLLKGLQLCCPEGSLSRINDVTPAPVVLNFSCDS